MFQGQPPDRDSLSAAENSFEVPQIPPLTEAAARSIDPTASGYLAETGGASGWCGDLGMQSRRCCHMAGS